MNRQISGFTLLELLVVLLILSLLFGVMFLLIKTLGGGALTIKKEAEALKERAYLSFRLKHQLEGLYGNLALQKKENELYLAFITTSGEGFNGIVKVRYRFSQGKLFYCETIYTKEANLKELIFCPEEKEFFLTKLKSFSVKINYKGRWQEEKFFGIPEKVEVNLDGSKILAVIRKGSRLP